MNEWVKLLIGSGITGSALLAIVIVFLFKNPDKFEHWMAIFYRLFYSLSSSFPKIKRKVDRRLVAASIQDSVNGVCEQINKESPDTLPHALKIEWIQSESPESFIKKGQVVVRLNHYINQDRNIVDSTLLYLKIGLLPRSKNYLDETLRKSCEFKVATQIFLAKRNTGAYDYFIEKELTPAVKNDNDIKADLQMLEHLDSVGFFTHVFLTEVKQAGEKLLGTMPTSTIQQELRNFAAFLQTIANKGGHKDVPLSFKGVKVKISVILVAKRETMESYGIAPYINRISRCVQEGYDSIYISAWGEEFLNKVNEIKNEIKENLITVLRSYTYPIQGRANGILIVCQTNLRYLAQRRELQNDVKQAMADIIPGIKNGDIEIISIARIKGVGCKIAVRMAAGGTASEATGACIGEKGERVAALRTHLSNEFIAIIPWSDDIKEFIINALTPLKESSVDSIEIDEEQFIANVKVNSDDAYKKALSRNNYNVKLASELVGWLINIEGPKKIKTMPTPDEELQELITSYVPEIKNGEIEIVRIARIKEIGSRVVVRWKDKHKNKSLMASQVCRGRNGESLKIIQENTGEWLYLHEWDDNPREIIIRCLYPLKKNDINSIDLNHERNTAIITLNDIVESKPLWRNQYNLALAERVTGWRIEIKENV